MGRQRLSFTGRQWADIGALCVVAWSEIVVLLVFGKHLWVYAVLIALGLCVFGLLARIWSWLGPLLAERSRG
jgi:hypothetical protein